MWAPKWGCIPTMKCQSPHGKKSKQRPQRKSTHSTLWCLGWRGEWVEVEEGMEDKWWWEKINTNKDKWIIHFNRLISGKAIQLKLNNNNNLFPTFPLWPVLEACWLHQESASGQRARVTVRGGTQSWKPNPPALPNVRFVSNNKGSLGRWGSLASVWMCP